MRIPPAIKRLIRIFKSRDKPIDAKTQTYHRSSIDEELLKEGEVFYESS